MPKSRPSLDSLTLRYATTNQAPEVTKVEVPDVNATNLENGKKLKLKWTATDANEDDLRYRLYVKKDGWDRWVELEDDWDKTDYEWDTTTTPSGVYRLKVDRQRPRGQPGEGSADGRADQRAVRGVSHGRQR